MLSFLCNQRGIIALWRQTRLYTLININLNVPLFQPGTTHIRIHMGWLSYGFPTDVFLHRLTSVVASEYDMYKNIANINTVIDKAALVNFKDVNIVLTLGFNTQASVSLSFEPTWGLLLSNQRLGTIERILRSIVPNLWSSCSLYSFWINSFWPPPLLYVYL